MTGGPEPDIEGRLYTRNSDGGRTMTGGPEPEIEGRLYVHGTTTTEGR